MNQSNPIRFKSFKLEAFDSQTGEVEGYASKFNNIDQVGDVVEPGAFAKSIANGGSGIRFLWQHDRREPIGIITEITEDKKGLRFKARFANTQRAQETRELMKMGAMDSFSIGYIPVIEQRDEIKGRHVNRLKEIRLLEISAVTFPANTEAKLNAIKSYGDSQFDHLTLDEQSLAVKFMDWLIDQREAEMEPVANDDDETVTKSDELEAVEQVAEEAPESVNDDDLQVKQLREQLELEAVAMTLRRAMRR